MTASLAKAELHLHIEGTLEPEMAFQLAIRNDVRLPYPDEGALARAYRFNDLQSFLTLYYHCMDVLRTRQDFYDLADAYLQRAHLDGVRHAEIFFDPQAHLTRGVPLTEVITGLSDATRDADRYGISTRLIACLLRDRSVHEAMDTVEALSPHREQVHGIGLDSAEVGHPPTAFREVFDQAARLGFRRVAHAGEEGPPDFIWQALDVLGVERIDHGIRAIEDPELLKRLATDQVPLTVCPLSNVRLRCVETLDQHPLPRLLDHGILVTINSDDPAYFGGYIERNYQAVQSTFNLSDNEMLNLAANSFRASFLPVDAITKQTSNMQAQPISTENQATHDPVDEPRE